MPPNQIGHPVLLSTHNGSLARFRFFAMRVPQPEYGDRVAPPREALCLRDLAPDVGQALLQRLLVDALRVVGQVGVPKQAF